MKCPKCNCALRTKDTGDMLTIDCVYLTAACVRCDFRLEVVGWNDHNAVTKLRNACVTGKDGTFSDAVSY